MSPITSNDTSTAIPNIGTAHRLPDPHLTQSSAPFPCRSPRRSSANAAHGGLEPPAVERFRRAYLHLSHSTASRSLDYMIRPLSTFVAHPEPWTRTTGSAAFRALIERPYSRRGCAKSKTCAPVAYGSPERWLTFV